MPNSGQVLRKRLGSGNQ